MGDFATLSADFRIQLPAALCAERGCKAGQKFALSPKGSAVLLMPSPERNEIAGMAKAAEPAGYRDRKVRF